MNRTLHFFSCILLLLPLFGSARQVLHINHPKKPWYGRQPAHIQDVQMEVWPAGAYARVELTMTLAATTSYPYAANDSLEGVLEFELPEGSFIHNSWLWLSPSVIIQAALIEKSRAVAAYNAVVARNVDPSLLQKLGAEQYQLNVFPILTTYPRKVRIFYATPLNWRGGTANFALPASLLSTSPVRSAIQLTVHHDASFATPVLLESPTTVFTQSAQPGISTAIVPATAYDGEKSLHLSYTTGLLAGTALLTTLPDPGASQGGTYQVVIDPSTVGGPHSPRYVTFIFDHRSASLSGSAYTVGAALDHVRSTLFAQFLPTDSFAFFYVHNNNVVQAGGYGWRPATLSSITSILASVPAAPTGESAQLELLLKTALEAASVKPEGSSRVVVLSNNTLTQQAVADTIYNRLQGYLGGSFPTQIDILNAATQGSWNGVSQAVVGDILWTKLALASGGTRYRYSSYSFFGVGSASGSFYEMPARNILKNIVRNTGFTTTFYDISLPLTNGLAYGWYDILGIGKWSIHAPYAEVGRYAGTVNVASPLMLHYMGPNGLVTDSVTITYAATGADTLMREAWTYNYITRLLSFNNPAYSTECIDSSIRARVLCPLTAFLALETGDTVGVSQPGTTPIGIEETQPDGSGGAEEAWLVASPNPFTDAVSVAFRAEPTMIEIFDATGRRVWSGRATGKRLRWDGTDAMGRALPPGLYLLRAHFPDRVATLKIQKR